MVDSVWVLIVIRFRTSGRCRSKELDEAVEDVGRYCHEAGICFMDLYVQCKTPYDEKQHHYRFKLFDDTVF